jgi:deazaflavin-dependent oxidoreductase (nitroreductase family)
VSSADLLTTANPFEPEATKMQGWIESVMEKYTLQLATTGRKTGLKRVTTIWFGILDGGLYVSSGRGEGSDWVKNINKDPRVEITIGEVTKQGIAKIIQDSHIKQRLRDLYWKKYHILMAVAEFSKILMRIPLDASIPVLIEIPT